MAPNRGEAMTAKGFRILAVAVPVLLLCAVLAWHYGWLTPGGKRAGLPIGGPFALTDQDGRARTDADFRGKLMLVYFGYSFCPDVCPTALQIMSVALDQLGKDADKVTPIFITVDPARDTPAHLKDYVANFGKRFVGLTGPEAEIAKVARAYRIYYAKAKGEGAAKPDEYLMDHSSIVFLMGRDGQYLAHFTHNTPSEQMARGIREHL
jgi:cytochrome oxidase Cu insertion factor (SCO1/SenC/PrrC family)